MQLITIPTLKAGLAALGLRKGQRVLMHCSLSAFGRIQGGAETMLYALTETIGPEGLIAMPTFTPGRFDPSEWTQPPVPESDWQRYRFETPLFDSRRTPVDWDMSQLYELFRTWPNVFRSNHSHSSFAAWGAGAAQILHQHHLEDRFGESSPLARLYDEDAEVLFLGTDYSTNTAFHLGEYRVADPPRRSFLSVQETAGKKRLIQYEDVATNSGIFTEIGADFETAGHLLATNQIGAATCRRFKLRSAVDFAADWLARKY
ncbi:MAG: aminoglycoside N(3)-acetyltransferase [Pseudomonadales bacterium]|nr:aminoglycoside N(3)-acetyltransferase [Pseudomonadales bacterium]